MVLKDNAIEILHGGMKVAHRRKSYRQNGSLFGSDRRFFAISHPAPLGHSGRACLDSPVRAALFYFGNARLAGCCCA